jgi:uncharacterized protein (DUF362 family)
MNSVIIKTCQTADDLKEVITGVILDLGGWTNFIKPGERVLLKPNVNTADPFPASTDPTFLQVMIEMVLAAGAGEVIIGDSSTFYQNTRKNFEKLGFFDLAMSDPRIRVISFDEGKWIKKTVKGGKFLKSIKVPEILDQVDRIIILPCLKTHFIANFTGALKLGVGFMATTERLAFHAKHTEEKIAELNLVYKPDLIIMDGRKCFITGGPFEGEVREPNKILVSASRVSIDIEAINIIKGFPGNTLAEIDAEELIQIKRAREVGIE